MSRPVDAAMAAERPAKRLVRELWLNIVEAEADHAGTGPLYVTMPGAAGYEIELLLERGVIDATATGAIAPGDIGKIVAVESSNNAVAELKKRFPGLSALAVQIQNLVAGYDRATMPVGDNRKRCCAKIINLDLNGYLEAKTVGGSPIWLPLELLVKLAVIHRDDPSTWYVFMTINAMIPWPKTIQRAAVEFLRNNITSSDTFRDGCELVLGGELTELIASGKLPKLEEMDAQSRQRFLMAFVPKRIAADVTHQGWRLETVENLHYGGEGGEAPMVTWIFRFHWDTRSGTQPATVYGESVEAALVNCATVSAQGERIDIV